MLLGHKNIYKYFLHLVKNVSFDCSTSLLHDFFFFFFFDNLIIGCVDIDIYIENTERCQLVELQVTTLLAM